MNIGTGVKVEAEIESTTANPASTVVFAIPIEILEGFKKLLGK